MNDDKVMSTKDMNEALSRGTSGWNEAQIRVLQRLLTEARVTSEVPELLRTAFNTKLLDGYAEYTAMWPRVFDTLTLTKGKAVDLPGLKGIHIYKSGAQASGETGREVRHTGPVSGEAKMEVDKYECIVGFDEDMLEDIEVDLMGWFLRMVGHRFKQKEDYVAFASVTTRGGSMTANTATGLTAASIASAIALEMNRTYTANNYTEREPIAPDTIIVDPTHLYTAQEILNTTLTVTTNMAGTTAAGGSNVFQNILNIVSTPYIDSDYYYIGKARTFGGCLFLRRLMLQIKNWEDLLRDTENTRAKARFDADVVEPDKWVRTAY